ncbi:autophagy protein Apg6-domain-containing protein [Amylocarpus encephaloides]|uniref:Autophagy protein Apg6-domain-containing protein n=1 Tax=Amylocarpus encephaloides TaxID=45428 RepID=A0A9P8C3X8_9HELO|nr:autophagy protein Apg6-domain-containing protein [Amylocarpus encephaloides]
MHCQKCRTPLKLDGSLRDLNPAAFDLLLGASSQQQPKNIPSSRPAFPQERKQLYDRVSKNPSSPTFKRHISSPRRGDTSSSDSTNTAMSFVMLTESQVVPPPIKSPGDTNPRRRSRDDARNLDSAKDEGKAMSQEMERVSRLFEILSARSDIDHPICVECTELLVEGLQRRLDVATKERDAYSGFLKQVNADIPTEDEVKDAQEQLAKAGADEAAAIEELKKLEKEKAGMDKEIAELEDEARVLDSEEEKFWRERNAFAMKLAEFQNIRDSVNQQYNHDSQLLEKLQRTNVYNDTFCIGHDGNFGTINGLRLGRLSNVTVDWQEINAAWGHTLLLLATVAEKLGFKFNGYELQTMGSTSRIIRYDYPSPSASRAGSQQSSSNHPPSKKILELYSSGDMPLGLTFMHRKFDTAMVAFLACMKQLGELVEKESSSPNGGRTLSLPYLIEGDKIGDVSIKLGIAQDDAWSRACKYTLTCCKFLLAHASNLNSR